MKTSLQELITNHMEQVATIEKDDLDMWVPNRRVVHVGRGDDIFDLVCIERYEHGEIIGIERDCEQDVLTFETMEDEIDDIDIYIHVG